MTYRKIVEADHRTDGVLVTMDCGHQSICNQIYCYPVGSTKRCFHCSNPDQEYVPPEPPTGQRMNR